MPNVSLFLHNKKNSCGFTLIELLIVMAIMGLMLTTGAVRYREYNKVQRIQQTTLTLKNDLRSAQARASSSQIPATCTSGYVGFTVKFFSTYYETVATCSNEIPVSRTTLPPGITLSSTSNITFYPLHRGALTDAIVTISAPGVTKTGTVAISVSGAIGEIPNTAVTGTPAPTAVPTAAPTLTPTPTEVPCQPGLTNPHAVRRLVGGVFVCQVATGCGTTHPSCP